MTTPGVMAKLKPGKKSAMQKKRSSSKKAKPQPAVRYLRYEVTNSATPDTETSHFIDLAKDLSAINRRLMRQGRHYHVKRVSIVSSNTNSLAPGQNAGKISFSTAPTSWVTQMAWQRGFKLWNAMQARAVASAGNDFKGTYNDFKVYLSPDHPLGTKLTPLDNGGNIVKYGDWSYSDLITPDGTTGADEFYLTILGDHSGAAGSRTSVGLVKSYGESRATVSEAPSPGQFAIDVNDPLMNLFDDGTVMDEVIAKFTTDGEDPPYDVDDYPGDNANMPKPLVVQQTTLGTDGRSSVGGFTAMCGLIEVEASSPIANDVYSVLVELAPGSYRGIAADVI